MTAGIMIHEVMDMVKNLRKLRLNHRLSQQQLADVIGVTQQSINKYENHNVEPDIDTLMRLADYFHTTVDYLVGRTPPEETEEEVLELNREEWVLVGDYRKLTKEERKSIRLVIKNYLDAL